MQYNQPPYTSFFLGELKGITVAPPPVTTNGRTEIGNGTTIGTSYNDKHLLMAETGDMFVSVTDGAAPYILTDNAPTWVQGNDDNNNITTTTYIHTITGGAFTGSMRLVKQGDGLLHLPTVTETYTGNTDIWAGTLKFDGTMTRSALWLNRFARLISNGGKFMNGITADYGAILTPGGNKNCGPLTTNKLTLNFGSRVYFELSSGMQSDKLNADEWVINTKSWNYGPTYQAPVFQFFRLNGAGNGKYSLGKATTITGNLSDIVVEGLSGLTYKLKQEADSIYLVIGGDAYDTPVTTTSNVQYSGSICWAFNQGTANQSAVVSSDFTGYVTPSVAIGSHLTYNGVRTLSSLTETLIGVTVDKESTANTANALSFNVQPASGCTFTPTRVEFTATRMGTDGGKIDAAWGSTSLASALTPGRNSQSPDYTTYSYSVQDVESADLQSLILNLYSLGITKQYGFANVCIYGTLSRPAASSAKGNGSAEAADISELKGDPDVAETYYTLSGMRIDKSQLQKNGIYICNGKKYVKK